MSRKFKLVWLLHFTIMGILVAQQVADTTFSPAISSATYARGGGPVVFIDQAHHNFHTKSGRYQAFARLLERDGYQVSEYDTVFEQSELSLGSILVISNALNEINVGRWYLPTLSAFDTAEIEALESWVHDGGKLFLIADHMPMAGAASELAAAFGFEFSNGFVMDTVAPGPTRFSIDRGTLVENVITQGRNKSEKVSEVVSFTGQGFLIPEDAHPILVFNENYVNRLPDTAWVFNQVTPVMNAAGWCQGAYKKHGKGKIVVFGEAAMFTAQLTGPQKFRMGMNHPAAQENYQLLLNIIHWLDDKME